MLLKDSKVLVTHINNKRYRPLHKFTNAIRRKCAAH